MHERAHRWADEALPRPETHLRVASGIIDVLLERGSNVAFGIPGSTISPLYDATHDRPGMRVVTAKHETMAAFMAAGWARATGRVGIVWVTSGPGILNALTGVASAAGDSVPLLVIVGEVATHAQGRGALQDGSCHGLGLASALAPLTKAVYAVQPSDDPVGVVASAAQQARQGTPGPVVVLLPVDIGLAQALARPRAGRPAHDPSEPSGDIAASASALAHARRPLILAGGGATAAGAALCSLAERLSCPVVTSIKGKGTFPESHPLSLGIFGHAGHPRAHAYVAGGIDVLLVVGCGLADTTTHGWTEALRPTQAFVQIDTNAAKIGRSYTVDFALVGDASETLRRISGVLPPGHDVPGPTLPGGRHHLDPASRHAETRPLHPARAVCELQAAASADTVFTVDIGEHMAFAAHHLAIDRAHRFVASTGLASMGSGIGHAIGLQLAIGNARRVVAICGDGGLLMYAGELATCVHERIPVTFAVFADRRLNMVFHGATNTYGRSHPFEHPPIDFVGMARAFGAHAERISAPGQLGPAIFERLETDPRPLVLELEIDPAPRLPSPNARDPLVGSFSGNT